MRDDLGAEVPIRRPGRVVSLVPSLTEAIEATVPGVLVGATDWCTCPPGLEVARVRGPKNPDRRLISALGPDLAIANQEENRRHDIERLRDAGVPVWVTRIDSIAQALDSLARLFGEVFALPRVDWLDQAREVWATPPRLRGRVAVPVWRDPWIWVGQATYPHDLLRRLGLTNVVDGERYPHCSQRDIADQRPDLVLLPDEPYPFTPTDGPDALAPSVPVSGRSLFWYGPAMVEARPSLEALLEQHLP
ncbi:MAG: helical backbone metal receptor [Propionibacteriaceae bacterium]|nr:helical backbone metal receptor [Propionibacteriaceae bacterium]